MLTYSLSIALAAPLVHEGSPDRAVAMAVERLYVDPSVLEPVRFDELRARGPALVGGGEVSVCSARLAVGPGTVAELLARAEAALTEGRWEQAQAAAADAREAVLCAPDAVAAPVLARIEVAAGVAEERLGSARAANVRYVRARGYHAEVAWPAGAGDDTLFREALVPLLASTLVVHPADRVLVDGAPAPERVLAGEHVVRVGDRTVRVVLDDLPNHLVVPAAYPADALRWMEDAAHRADVMALLVVGVGEGNEVAVVANEDVYRGYAGRAGWEVYRPPVAFKSLDVPTPARELRAGTRKAITGGLLGAAGGALVTAIGSALATDAALKAESADSPQRWELLENRYYVGRAVWYGGCSVVGAGVGVALAGTVENAVRGPGE